MRNSSRASGSRAFSSRYCCIIGVDAGSVMGGKRTHHGDTEITKKKRGEDNQEKKRGPDSMPDGTIQPISFELLIFSSSPLIVSVLSVSPWGIPSSEFVEGRLLVLVDLEDLVEPGDLEDFQQVG